MNTTTSKLRDEYKKWLFNYPTIGTQSGDDIADYWLAIIEAERTAIREQLERETKSLRKEVIHKWSESGLDQKAYIDGVEDVLAIIHKTLDV